MLIAVPGSSDLVGVLGIGSPRPDALLRAIRDRFGPFRHRHVLILSPRQLTVAAREQAHVLVAADPAVRICVRPLDHHALTLALIGRAALAAELRPGGWADPGQAVEVVDSMAARSRSLLWHPRLGSLQESVASLGERAAGLFPARSYFYELGSTGLIPERVGPGTSTSDDWYVAGEPPTRLRIAMGGAQLESVEFSSAGSPPYAGRRSIEISCLAAPYARPLAGPACGDCAATLNRAQCHFCGYGPVTVAEPMIEPAEASRAVSAEEGVLA